MKRRYLISLIFILVILLSIFVCDYISYRNFKVGKYLFFPLTRNIQLDIPIADTDDYIKLEEIAKNIVNKEIYGEKYLVKYIIELYGDGIINQKGVFQLAYQIENKTFFGPKYLECLITVDTSKSVISGLEITNLMEKDRKNEIRILADKDFKFPNELIFDENINIQKNSYFRIRRSSGDFQVIFIQDYSENFNILEQTSLIEWNIDITSGEITKVRDYRK